MTNGYGGRQERPWAEGGTVLASKDRCQGWEQDAKRMEAVAPVSPVGVGDAARKVAAESQGPWSTFPGPLFLGDFRQT